MITTTFDLSTLSLHDALPISLVVSNTPRPGTQPPLRADRYRRGGDTHWDTNWRHNGRYDWHNYRHHHRSLFHLRSEEHTSELQSSVHLVCRLLLEKKNT